jgi:hypothetical protein
MLIGSHELSREGQLIIIRYHGAVSLEEIREMSASAEQAMQSEGALFILNDMRRAGIPTVDARRYMQQWMERHPTCTFAHFGVSSPVRAMLFLIARAMTLLGKRPPAYTIFPSETEARAWISDRSRAARPSAEP